MNDLRPRLLLSLPLVTTLALAGCGGTAAAPDTPRDVATAAIDSVPSIAFDESAARDALGPIGVGLGMREWPAAQRVTSGEGWTYEYVPSPPSPDPSSASERAADRRVMQRLAGPRRSWPNAADNPSGLIYSGPGWVSVRLSGAPVAGAADTTMSGWVSGIDAAFPGTVRSGAGGDYTGRGDMTLAGAHTGRLMYATYGAVQGQLTGVVDGAPVSLVGAIAKGEHVPERWAPQRQTASCVNLRNAGYAGIRNSLMDAVVQAISLPNYRELAPAAYDRFDAARLTRLATLPSLGLRTERPWYASVEAPASGKVDPGVIGVRVTGVKDGRYRIRLQYRPIARNVAPINWTMTVPLTRKGYATGITDATLVSNPPLCAKGKGKSYALEQMARTMVANAKRKGL